MNREEVKGWLYANNYLFKEGTKDMQTICGTKLYHVELLESFQSALTTAPNTAYTKCTEEITEYFAVDDEPLLCEDILAILKKHFA